MASRQLRETARPATDQKASRGVATALQYQTTDHEMKDFESKWHYYRNPREGEKALHPRIERNNEIESMVHGRAPKDNSGHVEDLMKSDKSALQSFAYMINAQRERVYRSSKMEPLGQVPKMSYELPRRCSTSNPSFPGFGVQSDKSIDAKRVMYPRGVENEHVIHHPGRPKGVDWGQAHIDPKTHVFGKVDKNWEEDGVRKCIAPQATPVTKLVDFNQHQIAQSRQPMERSRISAAHIDPNITLGMPSGANDPTRVSARSCMTQSDGGMKYDDVGVSSRRVRGLIPQQVLDEEKSGRAFGLPGVRSDLRAPKNRRTDDDRNFGDECRAGDLISGADILLLKPSLVAPTSKPHMRLILERSGFGLSDADFEVAWKLSVTKYKGLVDVKPWNNFGSQEVSSPEAMKRACQELEV